jgi:hypothetical protein
VPTGSAQQRRGIELLQDELLRVHFILSSQRGSRTSRIESVCSMPVKLRSVTPLSLHSSHADTVSTILSGNRVLNWSELAIAGWRRRFAEVHSTATSVFLRKAESIRLEESEYRCSQKVDGVFRSNGVFLAELGPLAASLNPCWRVSHTFLLPTTGCVDRSGKPPAS